jgi:hypothetical protein
MKSPNIVIFLSIVSMPICLPLNLYEDTRHEADVAAIVQGHSAVVDGGTIDRGTIPAAVNVREVSIITGYDSPV